MAHFCDAQFITTAALRGLNIEGVYVHVQTSQLQLSGWERVEVYNGLVLVTAITGFHDSQ